MGGDVNSTLAVALVAARLGIPLGHVEAGLRSFDRAMPEEINRVVTDHLSTFLFTTEESANRNLEREGIRPESVHFVGNCMIDTLKRHVESAVARAPWKQYEVEPGEYALLTLHRPSNVDSADSAQHSSWRRWAGWPSSFRFSSRFTRGRSRGYARPGVVLPEGIRTCEPLPYETFLGLMARAKLVLTDSGGIQEETTALGVPCLTLRENTERPVTLTHGTNRLVGADRAAIRRSVESILAGDWPSGGSVPLWDGQAGSRIAAIVEAALTDAGARRDAVRS